MKRFVIGGALLVAVAGIAFLSTLGCCQLLGIGGNASPLSQQLKFTPFQREAVAALERDFMAQKQASCQTLCAKRAQLIQLLSQPPAERATLVLLVEEIGQAQITLEKATLEHLLALGQHLDSPQRERLASLMTEQLRTACRTTACGITPGCAVTGGTDK